MAGLEPVFTPGRPVWPLAGSVLSSLEPEDPDLAIPHGSLEVGRREAHHRHVIRDQSIRIAEMPAEALVPATATIIAGAKRKWSAALVASLVFHAAVALAFIGWAVDDDPTLIEGSDFSGIAMLGSSADQVSAGEQAGQSDPEATSVTMVTMLQANPVETVDAAAVPVETVESVEAQPVEVAAVERTEPVRESDAQQPVTAERPATALAERAEPVRTEQQATSVEPEAQAAPVATARLEPEILATDRPEIVEDTNTVPKTVEPVQAEPAVPTETMPVRPEETVVAEAVRPSETEPVRTEVAVEAEPEQVVKAETEVAEKLPDEVLKPERMPVEVAQEVPKPVRPADKKPVEKKPAKQARTEARTIEKPAEKPARQAKKAGNGGKNKTNARRGQADGQENGDSAQASRGGSRNGEVGNASTSNYKGKVVQKLMRAARSSSTSRRGVVTVSFTVTASGGVVGVSASGDASQRAEGIKLVKKAAPFPPPPPGVLREFSFPLELRGR